MTEKSHAVNKGDYLLIDYATKFEGGTVFDTTSKEKAFKPEIFDNEREYRPLFLRVDMGQVIKGIDKGVLEIAQSRTCKADLQSR